MRIGRRTPAKAGQPNTTGQFSQKPERRKKRSTVPRTERDQEHEGATDRSIVACKKGSQSQHSQCRRHGRESAVGMHGDESPTENHRKPSASEHPAIQQPRSPIGQGLFGTTLQQPCQGSQRYELKPPDGLAHRQPWYRLAREVWPSHAQRVQRAGSHRQRDIQDGQA